MKTHKRSYLHIKPVKSTANNSNKFVNFRGRWRRSAHWSEIGRVGPLRRRWYARNWSYSDAQSRLWWCFDFAQSEEKAFQFQIDFKEIK
jgi:hypothetical protein